ncbi:nuclear transport factor 2 family protein [Aestuariibius insulae]|uniref:nuclear transport factor 2 family protein n=1 Tax=Aestuariibius insulae TaxID=2058287 RepID=UPI00345EB03E
MKGFDERFADFPDYILGITREIWEDRGLGARMRDYYHPEVVVRTPWGIGTGEPGMTAATMATLVEFPDRRLLGEDVIWSGDPEAGMLSSHRIYSTATHLGHGIFGAPTGRAVASRALADCYAKDNQISDEWLIRDNGAVVRQIGQDPRDWAAEKVAAGRRAFTPDQDQDGPYLGRGNENEWGARLADLLERLMAAEFSVIPAEWDRACELAYPGGIDGHGWRDADRVWLGLRAAFPSAEFKLHHVIGREDPMMAPRAAVRWSLTGLHDGWGAFGAPSGAPVHVMGITQAEFGPWGLRREWTLWDETAIWMQIHAAAG